MSYSYKFRRKDDSFWHKFISNVSDTITSLDTPTLITATTIITYILVIFVGAYILLRRTGILPPNALRTLIWRTFVYSIPPSLVLALERREENSSTSTDPFESENSYANTRTLGAKSQAVKKILGLNGIAMYSTVAALGGTETRKRLKTGALPGLFNRNNECYQNSIIQGLASLSTFCDFIHKLPSIDPSNDHMTLTNALKAIMLGLNSPENHERGLWTPRALKSMSSWQQQDAQEYYSRLVDEVEKDNKSYLVTENATIVSLRPVAPVSNDNSQANNVEPETDRTSSSPGLEIIKLKNPLEGLQAQRVGCLQCGYVDGLSLIPFNCITLSLGHKSYYDLEGLLDSYTDLETIPGVECAKCTLTKQEKIIQRLLETRSQDVSSDDKLRQGTQARLSAVQAALQEKDFSEATLSTRCQIGSKARVTTDKTKQSVIARAPQSLVIHINRSVFDERTGTQLKNYSKVQFPKVLNLDAWCLGKITTDEIMEQWEIRSSISMLNNKLDNHQNIEEKDSTTPRSQSNLYALRALITHYGTHGDGHYVAWRQDPVDLEKDVDTKVWWRLSDDDVDQLDEETVLQQGGVFMLFYERMNVDDTILVEASSVPEEKEEAIADDLDSPSAFLSPEAKASLDAKLEKYIAPKDTAIASSTASDAEQKVDLPATSPSSSTISTAAVQTASKIRPSMTNSTGHLDVV